MKKTKLISCAIILLFVFSSVCLLTNATGIFIIASYTSGASQEGIYKQHPSATSDISAQGNAFYAQNTSYVSSVEFELYRSASAPSGTLKVKIEGVTGNITAHTAKPDGNVYAESVSTIDIATLPTSPAWQTFVFNQAFQCVSGQQYTVYVYAYSMTGNPATQYVVVRYTTSAQTNKTSFAYHNSAWANDNSGCINFRVYGVETSSQPPEPEQPVGDSTGSYNWIKNPSFEQTDEYAQSNYNATSYPWFLPYGGSGYVEENTTYHKYGVRSLHTGLSALPMTFWNLQYSYPIVAQSVTGVLSSTIENFTLWAMQRENYTSGIRVFVWFIDGTYTTMYNGFTNYNLTDWEFMNFTTIFNNYQGANAKYLASVAFVQDGRGYTFIDAVNMWASVQNPVSGSTFSFTLEPQPINYMNTVSGYGFNAYAGIQYTFRGFINNNSINGIFNVTALSIYQTVSTSGTVTNGQFSFIISPRSIAYANYGNFDETFWIVISGSDLNTTYSVDGFWTAPSATPPTDTDDITQNNMNFLITILPYLIIYGLCIGGGAYYLKFVGVLLGLNVAMIIVLLTGVVLNNISIIWVMPITILTDIVLVVFRPKEQQTTSMG